MKHMILLLFVVSGCGRHTDKSGVLSVDLSTFKGFLTPADLEIGPLIGSDSKDDITAVMSSMTDLYANIPDDGGADSCITTSMRDVKITLGTDYMLAQGEGPLSACGSSPKDDAVGGRYKLFAFKACAGGDFTMYQNKNFLEIMQMDISPCDGLAQRHAMVQHQVETDEKFESDGQTYAGKYKTIIFVGQPDLTPYEVKLEGNQYVSNNVVNLTKRVVLQSDYSDFNGKTGRYLKLIDRDVHMDRSGKPKFYTSGKVDITINEWNGSATFLGKDTNPTWQLNKGTDVVTGTYAGVSGK